MTQDELREVGAKAIFNGMMPSWHWDSQWYAGERAGAYRAFDAAIRAIEAAGYAVVPRDADIRLTDAGHVVHEVRGAPNDVWHSLLAAVLAASPPLAKET